MEKVEREGEREMIILKGPSEFDFSNGLHKLKAISGLKMAVSRASCRAYGMGPKPARPMLGPLCIVLARVKTFKRRSRLMDCCVSGQRVQKRAHAQGFLCRVG